MALSEVIEVQRFSDRALHVEFAERLERAASIHRRLGAGEKL